MFEFDAAKSESNKAKHGIDFEQAQTLWRDVDAVEIPARSQTEPRKLLIAKMDGKHWSAVFTEREDRIRIISVRRARTNEAEIYEQDDSPES